MRQAPDGKHLFTLKNIVEKVNKKYAKSTAKKLTFAALQKWAIRKNKDGTTWRDNYYSALARGNGRQKVDKR